MYLHFFIDIKHLQIELQSQTEKARNTLASERLEFEQEVQNLRSECIDMKQKLREASESKEMIFEAKVLA